jgi:hypothetical protein
MRNVVGILLAAAVGVHCSAPTQSPDPKSSDPELVATPGTAQTEAPRQAAPSADDQGPAPVEGTGLAAMAFAPFIADSAMAHLTSTVMDPATGASYAAGVFEGRTVIGGVAIRSRGDKDVFLMKIDSQGSFEWVRAVGSAMAESRPRVLLDDGTNHVQLVGTSRGRMDCGSGPMQIWSSETFFFCVFGRTDGAAISSAVFPTGAP